MGTSRPLGKIAQFSPLRLSKPPCNMVKVSGYVLIDDP